jgi:surface antigen
MQPQTGLFFYKFRYLLAAILTIAFFISISALVTAIGSKTELAQPSTGTIVTNAYDNPDVLTTGANIAAADAQNAMLATGRALYRTCRSITAVTVRSGKTGLHSGAVMASGIRHGAASAAREVGSSLVFTLHTAGRIGHINAVVAGRLWDGAASAAREVGSSLVFTLHLPGKVIGSFIKGQAVSTLMRPADYKSTPVISTETSAAVLASFNAEQQKEIAQWQASQLAANRSLDGAVAIIDSGQNDYPADWADAPQDSTLDSWGMDNRECVSYTAWKVYQTYGYMPYWGGVGNANEWPGDAKRAGIPTGSTPQVGSVAISMSGYYGHAMWVEKVIGDMIYVSQYNYDLHGHYSEMWVDGSQFTYIYFQ